MMQKIRQMLKWKKWYSVTSFVNTTGRSSGYNRSFCWSYGLDANQILAWETQLKEINGYSTALIINITPLKNGKGVTIGGEPQ